MTQAEAAADDLAVGEQAGDLRPFAAVDFARGLVGSVAAP